MTAGPECRGPGSNQVAVIPTLKLWLYEMDKAQVTENVRAALIAASQQQLKRFSYAGGQVLFGRMWVA